MVVQIAPLLLRREGVPPLALLWIQLGKLVVQYRLLLELVVLVRLFLLLLRLLLLLTHLLLLHPLLLGLLSTQRPRLLMKQRVHS